MFNGEELQSAQIQMHENKSETACSSSNNNAVDLDQGFWFYCNWWCSDWHHVFVIIIFFDLIKILIYVSFSLFLDAIFPLNFSIDPLEFVKMKAYLDATTKIIIVHETVMLYDKMVEINSNAALQIAHKTNKQNAVGDSQLVVAVDHKRKSVRI